jgi:hypothetical protein
MSEEEYAAIPETLELREILYIIHCAGQRDEVCTLITTLKDKKIVIDQWNFR